MAVLKHRFKIREKGINEEIKIKREKIIRREKKRKEKGQRYIVKEVVKCNQ